MTEDEFDNTWCYFRIIESDLQNTSRFVEVCENNLKTYSSEFAKIIMITCSEIDSLCKMLCDFTDPKKNYNMMKDYANILLKRKPHLTERIAFIGTLHCTPWDGLKIEPEYDSPLWWKEYQKIKHNRYNNFEKANLENALQAVGALFVLLKSFEPTIRLAAHSFKMSDEKYVRTGVFYNQP